MKSDEHVIGEAVRVELSEDNGKLYIVFEITDPQSKQDIKKNWTKDIEFRIINRSLVKND